MISPCEQCCDCVEFYHACAGCKGGADFTCADFRRLPDVGHVATGPTIPASRMGGRTQPRIKAEAVVVEPKPVSKCSTTIAPRPVAVYGEDGVRRCGCGVAIPGGKLCCNDCREQRRLDTVKRGSSKTSPPLGQEATQDTLPATRTDETPKWAVVQQTSVF